MKDIYIVGVGRNTPVYIDLVESCGYAVAGLYHFNEELTGKNIHGYKIVGTHADLLSADNLQCKNFALSMGDNRIRHELGIKLRKRGGCTPALINPLAYISRFVEISDGVIVHANSSVQADVSIGEDTVISFNVDIAHNTRIDEACFIAGSSIIGAYTHVESYTFVGVGCTVISGKVGTIGSNAYIGAGSVVTKSVDKYTVVAGNPARVIKTIPHEF